MTGVLNRYGFTFFSEEETDAPLEHGPAFGVAVGLAVEPRQIVTPPRIPTLDGESVRLTLQVVVVTKDFRVRSPIVGAIRQVIAAR